MDSLLLENVRCFHDRVCAELRPLTILVGENSTGKSTFLAMVRVAWDCLYGDKPQFNEAPFLLGAYRQIANYRGSRWLADSFNVGLSVGKARLTVKFKQEGSQPVVDEYSLDTNKGAFVLKSPDAETLQLQIDRPGVPPSTHSTASIWRRPGGAMGAFMHASQALVFKADDEGPRKKSSADLRADASLLRTVTQRLMPATSRPYAIAPIRSRPERTYHPVTDEPLPEGDHVPMVLNKLRAAGDTRWESMMEAIDKFGRDSGLFESLAIRQLGAADSDPFQLRIKISGPAFNLVDVGYGVSQVLPIIVDTYGSVPGMRNVKGLYLLQQPEVHLHPRAQAELGTFLSSLCRGGKRFIVETHSDHFVDRIRMEVASGKSLDSEDVTILFFERTKSGVHVHQITLDDSGNLIGAPASYREFFLKEQARFLTGQ